MRDINDTEELTMEYGWTTDCEFKRTKCTCNKRDCREFIETVVTNPFADSYSNDNEEGNIDVGNFGEQEALLVTKYPNASTTTSTPNDVTAAALLLLSDADKGNEHSSKLTTDTTTPSTAHVYNSIVTFTHPTDKEHSTYAALLSLLYHTVENGDSIRPDTNFRSNTETNLLWDILHKAKNGEPVSWNVVMDSALFKKFKRVTGDVGDDTCSDSYRTVSQFLSLIITELFPQHRLQFQFSNNAGFKMKWIDFVELPMATSSDFLLSNSIVALKAFVEQLVMNEDNCDISFNGNYFIATNHRHNVDVNESSYAGNVWGSYALPLPGDVTSEMHFAILCGFVIGTSHTATQFTYLRSGQSSDVQTWTLINGKVACVVSLFVNDELQFLFFHRPFRCCNTFPKQMDRHINH